MPRASTPITRRLRGFVAVLALILISTCAGSIPASGAGIPPVVHQVNVGDDQRSYLLAVPDDLQGPAPLVLAFHSRGSDAQTFAAHSGWAALAAQEGFVVAFPQGAGRSFNAGGCCGWAQEHGVDDVAATLTTIDDISAQVPIDPRRIYATGLSNGGHMVYRLACETDRFAAVAPVAGGLFVDCNDAAPTSLLHVHGLADSVVPFTGQRRAHVRLPATRRVIDRFRERMGCEAPVDDRLGIAHRERSQCPGGREVTLVTLPDVGHEWPTAMQGYDTTAAVWAFFKRH
ncbi:MAG: PHB depolymerase family esterase [Mobilicoccus sp.]|nr:PHB depolymerase family esterase [Mobilicoccus sp.]